MISPQRVSSKTGLTISVAGSNLSLNTRVLSQSYKSGLVTPDVPRGTVTGLSPASRLRLLRLLAQVKWASRHNKFITLTFPADYPNPTEAKNVYRRFCERFRRKYPDMCWIWRMELQQRGAPHFHLLSPNRTYVPKEWIQSCWSECVGASDLFTRIEAFHGRKVLVYVAKYVAKPSVQICAVVKTKEPANVGMGAEQNSDSLGRCWGVHNRPSLPLFSRYTWDVSPDQYNRFLEFLKSEFRHLQDRNFSSVSVFISDRAFKALLEIAPPPDLDRFRESIRTDLVNNK